MFQYTVTHIDGAEAGGHFPTPVKLVAPVSLPPPNSSFKEGNCKNENNTWRANKLNVHFPSNQRKTNGLFSSEKTSIITVTIEADNRQKKK